MIFISIYKIILTIIYLNRICENNDLLYNYQKNLIYHNIFIQINFIDILKIIFNNID
jgi:hypothetical protein